MISPELSNEIFVGGSKVEIVLIVQTWFVRLCFYLFLKGQSSFAMPPHFIADLENYVFFTKSRNFPLSMLVKQAGVLPSICSAPIVTPD